MRFHASSWVLGSALFAAFACVGVIGCGDDDGTPGSDAGRDAASGGDGGVRDSGPRDGAAMMLDAGGATVDSGIVTVDAGGGTDDAGSVDVDAGSTDLDGGGGDTDAGGAEIDAGSGGLDAGSSEIDAGGGEIDAGGGDSDAGSSRLDAGSSDIDAGTALPGVCSATGCTPTCFRAINCVTVCGGPVTSCGCCPCAAGSFDDIICPPTF